MVKKKGFARGVGAPLSPQRLRRLFGTSDAYSGPPTPNRASEVRSVVITMRTLCNSSGVGDDENDQARGDIALKMDRQVDLEYLNA